MAAKKKDTSKLELELYETKWFDYRPASPDVATMMFMRDYAKAMATYKSMVGHKDAKTGLDNGGGQYTHTLKAFGSMELESVRKQVQFRHLEGLRQWADKHGMRYDKFWSWATEAHLKLKFHKTFISVFFNEKILAEVKKAHDEWAGQFLQRSEHEFFRASNFKSYPVQCDYYDYVIGGILKRNSMQAAAKMLAGMAKDGEIDIQYLQGAVKRASERKAA